MSFFYLLSTIILGFKSKQDHCFSFVARCFSVSSVILIFSFNLLLSQNAIADEPPQLDFIGGYYDNGEYRCYSEPCFTIHRGTDAAASRIRPFAPQDWQTKRGECQKSYTQVLAETSLQDAKYAKHEDCVFVVSGEWGDAYTGQKIDDIRVIALDHRVSPYEAHYWGAAYWTPAQRVALLNDPINLVPVSIEQIKLRKGRSPTEWMPEKKDYWCDYIVHREIVVRKYELRPSKEVRDFEHEIKKLYCKY